MYIVAHNIYAYHRYMYVCAVDESTDSAIGFCNLFHYLPHSLKRKTLENVNRRVFTIKLYTRMGTSLYLYATQLWVNMQLLRKLFAIGRV